VRNCRREVQSAQPCSSPLQGEGFQNEQKRKKGKKPPGLKGLS
jgi:hypothetical protein